MLIGIHVLYFRRDIPPTNDHTSDKHNKKKYQDVTVGGWVIEKMKWVTVNETDY